MNFLDSSSIEQAIKMLAKNYKFKTETVPTAKSVGRFLACTIVSPEDVPNFNRSTVDGYAIHASDTFGSSESIPAMLELSETIAIGEVSDFKLNENCVAYVPTGGMIPENADAVVMIEHTSKIGNTICVHKPTAPGSNIVYKGDDAKIGTVLMEKGRCINPKDIGILSACGVNEVNVFKKPKIFVISTGDELIGPDDKLSSAKVRDINTSALSAQIEHAGFEPCGTALVKDDLESITKSLETALLKSDVVLISGGSSKGERDFTIDAIEKANGEILFHGLRVKPGKPTIGAVCNGKTIVGLPGHPLAAVLIFREVVAESIFKNLEINTKKTTVFAELDCHVHSDAGKKTYVFVSLEKIENSGYKAIPILGKSSLISIIAKADGFFKINENKEGITEGQTVEVTLL